MRTDDRQSAHVGRWIWLTVLVACLVTRHAAAQDPYSVRHLETEVESVISGGTWKFGSAEGTFRLIVVAANPDHGSRTFVQWMESRTPARIDVRRTVELNDVARVYSLSNPRLSQERGRWLVIVTARTNNPSAPARTLTFELGAPGRASLRR